MADARLAPLGHVGGVVHGLHLRPGDGLSARDLVFLWPNNDQMDARAEGYIDDYHFLTPTGDTSLQVMYVTITDGAIVPIAVAAVLLNP